MFFPHLDEFACEPRILNPLFAGSGEIGGADADLIAAGCLIDVKTTVVITRMPTGFEASPSTCLGRPCSSAGHSNHWLRC